VGPKGIGQGQWVFSRRDEGWTVAGGCLAPYRRVNGPFVPS